MPRDYASASTAMYEHDRKITPLSFADLEEAREEVCLRKFSNSVQISNSSAFQKLQSCSEKLVQLGSTKGICTLQRMIHHKNIKFWRQ